MIMQKYLKRHHVKVDFVGDRILKDYAGMNYYSAKKFHFPFHHPKNVILIDKNESKTRQRRDIKHEVVEMEMMKHGYSYWKAHETALRKEK